jgi:selenide,water dikinase
VCQQDLVQVLSQLPKFDDPRILIGGDTMDDAGVYRLTEDLAIVQTVDILTPIADDPYVFGQIAAANSLSDVYAMGATPLTALCVVGFPVAKIDNETICRMLGGVADKVREAGACLLGGHTTRDQEVKCGLAVTGAVSPDKIVANSGAKPGNKLILTKPLGTGVISTALKVGLAPAPAVESANRLMCELNKTASETMIEIGVTSATDITGFGLLGHAYEMAAASNVSLRFDSQQVPIIREAYDLAGKNLFPGGSIKNFEFVETKSSFAQTVSPAVRMLLCDAQTSGGLLISVPREKGEALVEILHQRGIVSARMIGEVIEKQEKRIYVE